jgi:hypothetical protein
MREARGLSRCGGTMSKRWIIWAEGFGEVNEYYLDNYDAVLRMVQSELEDGYFDLDDIMIEELEEVK